MKLIVPVLLICINVFAGDACDKIVGSPAPRAWTGASFSINQNFAVTETEKWKIVFFSEGKLRIGSVDEKAKKPECWFYVDKATEFKKGDTLEISKIDKLDSNPNANTRVIFSANLKGQAISMTCSNDSPNKENHNPITYRSIADIMGPFMTLPCPDTTSSEKVSGNNSKATLGNAKAASNSKKNSAAQTK